MKIIKKDLNLFDVYKQGPGKAANSGNKLMLTLIASFLLIIALIFGALYFVEYRMKSEYNKITDYLKSPTVASEQRQLNELKTKNNLLMTYSNSIGSAKSAFESITTFDTQLLSVISSSMPVNTLIETINYNSTSITLYCTSTNVYAPAAFKQNLEQNELISSITYNSISLDQSGVYTFTLSCTLS